MAKRTYEQSLTFFKHKTKTHSSTLAWRIPWTEEPGGLRTVHGSQSDMTE